MKLDPELQKAWQARYDAVGRVQARYLFILLVLGVFFWALDAQVSHSPGAELTVPVLELRVSADVVWVAGPPALMLMLLGFLGALNAAREAKQELGGARMEPYDLHPNLIDMVVYRLKPLPRPWSLVRALSYPATLWAAYVEVVYLSYRMNAYGHQRVGILISTVLTLALAIPAAVRLSSMTWERWVYWLKTPAKTHR